MRIDGLRRIGEYSPRRARLPLLALVLVFAVAACSGGSAGAPSGSGTSEQPRTLNVAYPQEPPTWSYLKTAATAAKAPLMYNVLEPLLEEVKDGSLEPLLAESYDVNDDGTVYTFHIRDAKFHDGAPVTAQDVADSLKRNKSTELGKVSSPLKVVEAIEVVDDATVSVTLSRPSRKFIRSMANASGIVVPSDITDDELAKKPVGTGPYTFSDYKPGSSVTLKRFADYWGEAPAFDTITWHLITDDITAINSLLAGDIDVIGAVQSQNGLARIESVATKEQFDVIAQTSTQMSYLSLNAEVAKFDDERVRQAIAHAIDRKPIVEGAVAGFASTTCTFAPPDVAWASDYCPYPYDPAKSKELLKAAGAEGLTVPFKHLTIAEFPAIFQIVSDQLKQVGITVEGTGRDLTTYLNEVVQKYDYELTSLTGAAPIDNWKCPGRFTRYCDEEFDSLLEQADRALEKEKWASLRKQAIERHADAAYLIPIFAKKTVALYRSDIAGVKEYRASSTFDMRGLHWAN